jgi:hypothetical protein
MRGGGVEILDVFAIALITDRPEAFAHDRFGKARDGGERIADIVTYSGDKFRLGGRGALRLALGGLFVGCVRRWCGGRGSGRALGLAFFSE